MRIEFELMEEDLIAFNREHLKQSKTYWARLVFLVVVSAFVLWTTSRIATVLLWRFSTYSLVIGGFLGLIVFDVLRWRNASRRLVRKMLRDGHGRSVLGQHRLSITSEYVCAETPAGEEKTKWHAIWKIVATNDYAFIYNTRYSAFVVPRRAFATQDAFRAFVKQAGDFHEQSQDYGLVCEKCGFDLRGITELGCPECGRKREG